MAATTHMAAAKEREDRMLPRRVNPAHVGELRSSSAHGTRHTAQLGSLTRGVNNSGSSGGPAANPYSAHCKRRTEQPLKLRDFGVDDVTFTTFFGLASTRSFLCR
jgi:hypothetical protein